ncbi:alpha/beta fold hydrolase [Tritonibacter horizontis]|uniref:Lipase 1 n=1 Tax=Tritonibacter horizontis TaxID=1768241 RepID=A0A132BX76_9RHOB|nr:alpha/beta hydrolase [Tritonibacter horizontis]KUP92999.1 lipase 1 precursor [Tritonibacter horizontis]
MTWLLIVAFLLVGLLSLPSVKESLRRPVTESMRRFAPGQFAELSQGVTHYRWIGPERGPVAVCVHGITTPSEGFAPLAQELAGMGYRVLVYDLFGRGYSDYVPGPQGSAFFHQQLQDLLAHEGVVEDFLLIGYSAGGCIATSFAAQNLARVRQLILIATVGLHAPRTPVAAFMEKRPGLRDLYLQWTYPMVARRYLNTELTDGLTPDAVTRAQRAQTRRRGFFPSNLAAMRGLLREDLDAAHRSFNQQGLPVLALWGGEDRIIPAHVIGRMAELNRSAKQDVIAGAGHGVVYTHPKEIAQLIYENQRHGIY